jgi:hypothetical protein
MSPMLVPNEVFGVFVNWATNGSGVALEVCAATDESEPPMSIDTLMAHKNPKNCFTNSSAIKT